MANTKVSSTSAVCEFTFKDQMIKSYFKTDFKISQKSFQNDLQNTKSDTFKGSFCDPQPHPPFFSEKKVVILTFLHQ